MSSYNTDQNIRFRYRLNENFKEDQSTKQIEGITLKKDLWVIFPQKMMILSKYIKTIENKEGVLDYEEFNQVSGEIYNSSVNNYQKLKEGKIPNYTRAILATMKRPQLTQICDLMDVETIHMNNSVLVNRILEKQQILKDMFKK